MIAVVALAVVIGAWAAVYREHRNIHLAEAEYYHRHAKEAPDPSVKATFAQYAKYHDSMARRYGAR
jgi:hypothetical protein